MVSVSDLRCEIAQRGDGRKRVETRKCGASTFYCELEQIVSNAYSLCIRSRVIAAHLKY